MDDEVDEIEGAEDRWTPDDVAFRDVSTDPAAHDEVESTFAFADDLRALGFEPLAVHRSTMVEQLECIDDETLEELRDGRQGGAARDEARQEFEATRAFVEELNEHGSLSWVWVHPTTLDHATVEHNGLGDWLTFQRRLVDGRLLRTMRAPERMDRGNGSGLGPLTNTRIPLLFRWFEWLLGQHWRVGLTVMPHVGQVDQRLWDVAPDEAWSAHQAMVETHGQGADVVRPTSAGVLAENRRTMHVTHARMGAGVWPAIWQGALVRALGWAATVAIAALGVPDDMSAWFFAGLVLPYASRTLWAWACGAIGHGVTAVWVLGSAALVWWRGWPPGPLALAAAVSLLGVAASRSLWLWRTRHNLPIDDDRVDFPPPVPADEFEWTYRA